MTLKNESFFVSIIEIVSKSYRNRIDSYYSFLLYQYYIVSNSIPISITKTIQGRESVADNFPGKVLGFVVLYQVPGTRYD